MVAVILVIRASEPPPPGPDRVKMAFNFSVLAQKFAAGKHWLINKDLWQSTIKCKFHNHIISSETNELTSFPFLPLYTFHFLLSSLYSRIYDFVYLFLSSTLP